MILLSPSLLGGAAALLGALAYGVNIPAARVAAQGGVNGANIAMQRSAVLILVLALIIWVLRKGFAIRDGQERKVAAMGLLAGTTGACYLSSLGYVPVATAVAVFYTFPLLLILAGPFTGKGPITAPRMAAFAVAFAGILICVGPGLDGVDWRGIALAMTASVSCAALFHLTSTVDENPVKLMFWTQVFAQVAIVPAALLSGISAPAAVSANLLPIIISALGFYIGFACQIFAGRLLAPATVGLLFLLEPVVAILSASAFLGESLRPLQYLGMAMVVGGLAFDVLAQRRAKVVVLP
ncbi:MAG: DMT family transporter [Beijerinckiaceae bacterium]